MPIICPRYAKDIQKISGIIGQNFKNINHFKSQIPSHGIVDVVLAWSHPYGRYGIIKQRVFNVYPVSSPQAHVSKFSLYAVLVLDLIQGQSSAQC